MAVLAFQGLERAHVRISIYRRYILIPGGTWVKKSKLSRPIRSHPYLLFSMHLTSLFATAVAIIPLASAVAIHTNESYLESDTYAARAWINQQDYQRNGVPKAWATCNDKNTVVRKEWYAIDSRSKFGQVY